MKIVVSDERHVDAVQQEFHANFPFLRLEFFQLNGTNHRKKIASDKAFISYASKPHPDPITITPAMTVSELEKKMRDYYGLSTQILRKSGKVWLETSLTDHWSLGEQNEQGKSLSL